MIIFSFRAPKPVSRPVVRNIRNDQQSRGGKGKAPAQSKRAPPQKGGERGERESKAPVKAKVDTGRKSKQEEKPVNVSFLFNVTVHVQLFKFKL